MDKTTLITGATGLVGYSIVMSLLRRGKTVRVLARSTDKAKNLLPPEVEISRGDILDKSSLAKAIKGCGTVYHAAGLPEQWFRNPDIFQQVNVTGTQNIIDVCFQQKVEQLIYTSTIDVFEGKAGERFDETMIDPNPKGTHYERSKQDAFRLVLKAIEKGLPAVNIHPAGLYGPGPAASPGFNQFIIDLKKGKVPMLLPGGLPLVLSTDIGEGHVLAAEKGKIGESYILSEGYYELPVLAEIILKTLNINKKPPKVMPLPVVKTVSVLGEWLAGITGKPPLIPKGQLHFLLWKAIPDSTKAQRELGWKPVPIETGIKKTVEYLFK
ncbi:MAG: NAD-dependent epimerase/dehydratase family protein [Chlorobi bacterium]|nr:NAD-dependent epimerase/dehydratase family protein [Chlorobiota bacterium]